MNLLRCFATIVSDAEKLAKNVKKTRKPRKRKTITADRQVSKMNYQPQDTKLKLHSIDPMKIIGANQLWVFNTKTRKLGIYHAASDGAGLGVKGSTLQNFSEMESVEKTIRKPADVLPKVTEGGKVILRKLMETIKAKPKQLTGRINKHTILLRVA